MAACQAVAAVSRELVAGVASAVSYVRPPPHRAAAELRSDDDERALAEFAAEDLVVTTGTAAFELGPDGCGSRQRALTRALWTIASVTAMTTGGQAHRRLKNRAVGSSWSPCGCRGHGGVCRQSLGLGWLRPSPAIGEHGARGADDPICQQQRREPCHPDGDQGRWTRWPGWGRRAATARLGAHEPSARCGWNPRSRFRRRGRGSVPRGYH
jgi:hypothetical protein